MKRKTMKKKARDRMKKSYCFEQDGEQITLSDIVEICAVGIGESIFKKEKREEEIMRDCKILNSLSNALLAIKK